MMVLCIYCEFDIKAIVEYRINYQKRVVNPVSVVVRGMHGMVIGFDGIPPAVG
jgi:hypothetical protein